MSITKKKVPTEVEGFDDDSYAAIVFHNAPVGIAYVSREGTVIRANKFLARKLGYAVSELVGKHFKDLTHPEYLEVDLHEFTDLVSGHSDHYSMQKAYVPRHERPFVATLDVFAIRDEDGNFLHAVGYVRPLPNGGSFMALQQKDGTQVAIPKPTGELFFQWLTKYAKENKILTAIIILAALLTIFGGTNFADNLWKMIGLFKDTTP